MESLSSDNNDRGKKRAHILCVGAAAVDYVALVSEFPKPDDKIRSSELIVEGGGNAANTACAIGRLQYCNVSIATSVGDDANARIIQQGLMKDNVRLSPYVQQFDNASSSFTYILSDTSENTRTCIHQPVDYEMSIDKYNESAAKNDDDELPTAVHFDARHAKTAVHMVQHLCLPHDIPYSVDVEKPRDGLNELMAHATIILCNSQFCDKILSTTTTISSSSSSSSLSTTLNNTADDETSSTTNKKLRILKKLKRVMTEMAPKAKIIVTTLGDQGSCLYLSDNEVQSEEEVIIMEGEYDDGSPVVTYQYGALWCSSWKGSSCPVVDTTGAGDAFQGGFLTALWTNYIRATTDDGALTFSNTIFAHCLLVATRVAAQKIQQPGARKGLPYSNDKFIQEQIQSMLQKS